MKINAINNSPVRRYTQPERQAIMKTIKFKPKAKETNDINSYFTKTLKTSSKTVTKTPKPNAFVKVLKNIINVFKHIR